MLAPLFGYGVLAVLAIPIIANVLKPLLGLSDDAVVALQGAVLAGVHSASCSWSCAAGSPGPAS